MSLRGEKQEKGWRRAIWLEIGNGNMSCLETELSGINYIVKITIKVSK